MHIHDLNLYDLTFNCLFAPIGKLLKNGFDSGTGFIRSPKSIQSAASITAVILQLQSNQQFGGIASANLDFELAPYVDMSFKKNLAWILASEKVLNERSCAYESFDDIDKDDVEKAIKKEAHAIRSQMAKDGLSLDLPFKEIVEKYDRKAVVQAYIKTKDDTYQAMEGLVHNLNSLQSRSGNQVPFSSLNFGLDTSRCGRLVSSNLIAAQMAGLGDGLTAIFPILIIKYMKGVSYLPEDPNYDLKKAGIACLARRFYPNAVGVDNKFNAPYIRYEYNDDFKLTNDTPLRRLVATVLQSTVMFLPKTTFILVGKFVLMVSIGRFVRAVSNASFQKAQFPRWVAAQGLSATLMARSRQLAVATLHSIP